MVRPHKRKPNRIRRNYYRDGKPKVMFTTVRGERRVSYKKPRRLKWLKYVDAMKAEGRDVVKEEEAKRRLDVTSKAEESFARVKRVAKRRKKKSNPRPWEHGPMQTPVNMKAFRLFYSPKEQDAYAKEYQFYKDAAKAGWPERVLRKEVYMHSNAGVAFSGLYDRKGNNQATMAEYKTRMAMLHREATSSPSW